jgi:8-oxo-dGTP pyrophosphatase MutT (NUDIX family)
MPSGEAPGASPAPEGARFRTIGERERFDGGFFKVVTTRVVGPDGFIFEREVIHHPGAVCIVPLEADGRHVLMIRQYRAAVGQAILELPAGKRDVSEEDPALCAARELVEEIGREASLFTEIAQFYNSPGFCDERTICFLATGLSECAREAHGVEEENLTIERIALDDLEELMAAGDLVDAKSIVALAAARSALGWKPQLPEQPAPEAVLQQTVQQEAPPPAAPSEPAASRAGQPHSAAARRQP